MHRNWSAKETKEEWLERLCRRYAEGKLLEKYNPDKEQRRAITINNICYDGRRRGTLLKYLKELNLIAAPYISIHDELEIDEKELEAILKDFSTPADFSTSGKKKKESYLSSESILKNRLENYKDLNNLISREIVHIYLNQDKYDIHIIQYSHNTSANRYSYNRTSKVYYRILVYPKDMLEVVEENIYNERALEYALFDLNKVIKRAFSVDAETFYNTNSELKENTKGIVPEILEFREPEELTEEKLSDRLTKVDAYIETLTKAKEELLNLKKEVKDDTLKEKLISAASELIRESSPLWMMDKNEYLKGLAMLYLKKDSVEAYK